MRALVLAAAVSMWSPSSAHALCISPAERFVALNSNTAVPAGGGLLIETRFESQAKAPVPSRNNWKQIVDGGDEAAATIELAPGLDLVRLPDDGKELSVTDAPGVLGTVTRAKRAAAALAAPKVVSIEHATWPSSRGSSNHVVVTPARIPAGAVALIIADATTGKARSFGLVKKDETYVEVYAQGRCSALPNGTVPTVGGDRVVVRWVDRYGRLSPKSKVIKVPPTTVQK